MAEQIIVDIEELPAVTEPIAARDDPPALVHEEWGDNIYVQHDIEGGDIDSVRDAPVVVTRDYRMNRQSVSPLEPRAVLARWDERLGELVVYISSQIPHLIRTALSQFLNLPTHQLRVIAPDVGGGFGGKARLMPEEIVVCAIALETPRNPGTVKTSSCLRKGLRIDAGIYYLHYWRVGRDRAGPCYFRSCVVFYGKLGLFTN